MPAFDLPPAFFWIVTATVGLAGLCIGSFLNVCAWRIPRGESIVFPGSHCPKCGHAIGALENIPVLSWLFGLDLAGCRGVLLVLLGGGVLLAFYHLGQEMLVVLRRQAWGTPGMVLAAASVFATARPFVARWGLWGAAWSYFTAVSILAVCSGSSALYHFRMDLSGTGGRVRDGEDT